MTIARTNRKIGREGRKRRAAGWMLLALGVLVAGVWMASGWWELAWKRPPWNVLAGAGEVGVTWEEWSPAPNPSKYAEVTRVGSHGRPFGWHIVEMGDRWAQQYPGTMVGKKWPLRWITVPGRHKMWALDLVAVFVPLLLGAALLLIPDYLRRRRATVGGCAKCGYQLAGLAAGSPCPECGKASAVGTVSPHSSGS